MKGMKIIQRYNMETENAQEKAVSHQYYIPQ